MCLKLLSRHTACDKYSLSKKKVAPRSCPPYWFLTFWLAFCSGYTKKLYWRKGYNLLPLRVCWYVQIPVGTQGTEGLLHHSKDQIINGHDPIGLHEEGLSVNVEICELNDDSSHERSRTAPRDWSSQSEDSESENGCCTMETCKGQLTGPRSDSLHLITWAVLMPAASEMIPGSFNLVTDSWG